MGISLKRPKPALPDVTLRVRLPGEVGADLKLYAKLFEEQYGEPITPQQIAGEIIAQNLAKDPELRRRRLTESKLRESRAQGRSPDTPVDEE